MLQPQAKRELHSRATDGSLALLLTDLAPASCRAFAHVLNSRKHMKGRYSKMKPLLTLCGFLKKKGGSEARESEMHFLWAGLA